MSWSQWSQMVTESKAEEGSYLPFLARFLPFLAIKRQFCSFSRVSQMVTAVTDGPRWSQVVTVGHRIGEGWVRPWATSGSSAKQRRRSRRRRRRRATPRRSSTTSNRFGSCPKGGGAAMSFLRRRRRFENSFVEEQHVEKSEACPVVALLPEHDGEHVYSSSSPRRAARAYHPPRGPSLCVMRRWRPATG